MPLWDCASRLRLSAILQTVPKPILRQWNTVKLQGFAFPENTALPMFAEDDESVFMLEMHYDNQDYVPSA